MSKATGADQTFFTVSRVLVAETSILSSTYWKPEGCEKKSPKGATCIEFSNFTSNLVAVSDFNAQVL